MTSAAAPHSQRAAALGLTTEFIQTAADQSTGSVSVRLDAEGHPDFTIHRPAAYDCLTLDDAQLRRLAELRPDWIYFGTLYPMQAAAREIVRRLMDAMPHARRFYDVNLRRDCYTPELVRELLAMADAVKMNDDEAALFPDLDDVPAVAITRGGQGCDRPHRDRSGGVPRLSGEGGGYRWRGRCLRSGLSAWTRIGVECGEDGRFRQPVGRAGSVASRCGA